MTKNSKTILSQQGDLSAAIPGFKERTGQIEMAETIEEAIDHQRTVVVEAATGIGKTFAYLIPALLSGKKVIVSTGTKHLQDQLFHRDLPQLLKILKLVVRVRLLKGRANYLCTYRLDQALTGGTMATREEVSQLKEVRQWQSTTTTGDIAEMRGVDETASIWRYVTSTAESCLGQDCPDYQECFIVKARRQAQQADLLVVNHHLFFADLAMRDTGFGELLPGADVVVFDEAHQLPEIASQFFGEAISSRQFSELCKDILMEQLNSAPEVIELRDLAKKVETKVSEFRLALGEKALKWYWHAIYRKPQVVQAVEQLDEALQALKDLLQLHCERSGQLDNLYQRLTEQHLSFKRLTQPTPENTIHWYEVRGRYFRIHHTPLAVGEHFQQSIAATQRAWIYTSATLSTFGNLSHFINELNLKPYKSLQIASPFNYQQQSLLYIPQNLPQPSHPDYIVEVLNRAIDVITASQGRAFLLFTSHRALQFANEYLSGRIPYRIFCQGSAAKRELLAAFQRTEHAVLLGTSSFWEGVDIKGDALSVVMIDKLPFAAPDDPIVKARVQAMQKNGQNGFRDYQLPKAILALKQGSGRLIRDVADKGVLMLCDPRLQQKDYGQDFLQSLPQMPITHTINDIKQFFKQDSVTA